MNDDELFNEIRALRSADTDWANSPEGKGVMARAIAMGEQGETATARAERPAVRRTRRMVIAGIGAGALMVTGVAAATLVFGEADSPTEAGCYETLDPQADTTQAPAALVAKVGPTEACAVTWAKLGTTVDVTNLVSCVNEYGGRGVFPAPKGMDSAATCQQIGWAVDAG